MNLINFLLIQLVHRFIYRRWLMGLDTNVPIIELKTFSDTEYTLPKSMRGDPRYPNESNDKFLQLNQHAFEFLNIEAHGKNGKIHFRTNELVGAIPIRMPNNGSGTPQTDLVVKPRYQSNQSGSWYEWMSGLAEFSNHTLITEQNSLFPLTRLEGSPSPKYLLAKEIILKILPVLRENSWRKFDSLQKVANRPVGNVDWDQYAINSVDPQKRLIFETRINSISEDNREFRNALAYFNAAVQDLRSFETPLSVKVPLQSFIDQIQNRIISLGIRPSCSLCNQKFAILHQDPTSIQKLKRAINNYIDNESKQVFAWRIDFSKIYEDYVQKIVQLGLESVKNNDRISRLAIPGYSHQVTRLMPGYLEPDIIAEFGGSKIVIDAKYKSYFFDRQLKVKESQRERMRSDVHQIVAYTSLFNSKIAMLVAPVIDQDIRFDLIQYGDVYVAVIGLPLEWRRSGEYARQIRKFVRGILEQM